MDDKAFAAQKARVARLMARWIEPLGLAWWRLDVEWHRGPLPPYLDEEPLPHGRSATMDVRADWKYNHAVIRVCLPDVADLDDEKLEWAWVHELGHLFLNEMREGAGPHEERVASTLASAFIWLREHCERPAAARARGRGIPKEVADAVVGRAQHDVPD